MLLQSPLTTHRDFLILSTVSLHDTMYNPPGTSCRPWSRKLGSKLPIAPEPAIWSLRLNMYHHVAVSLGVTALRTLMQSLYRPQQASARHAHCVERIKEGNCGACEHNMGPDIATR